jgi:drug/metabolite transporter (DMT)-like permease
VWLIPLTTIALGTRHNLRTWLSTLVAVLGVFLLGWA